MVDRTMLGRAMEIHRQAVESTYEGACNIYEWENIMDPDTKITSQKEVIVFEDTPCRVSFTRVVPAYKQGKAQSRSSRYGCF